MFVIWSDAVKATHHFLSPDQFSEIAALVRDQYLPIADLVVAEIEGQPVGFMGLSGCHIDSLFIHPDMFGQGVGRAFIAQAEQAGAPLSVDVNEDNPGAIEFYQRMGFKQVRRSETDDSGRPFPILHLEREV